MIQLEQQQHREFWVGWGGVGGSHTKYLYPARWGWIKKKKQTKVNTQHRCGTNPENLAFQCEVTFCYKTRINLQVMHAKCSVSDYQ